MLDEHDKNIDTVADDDRPDEVFAHHISQLRDLQFDRMKTLQGRGALILKTDLAVLTAAGALAALTIGRSSSFRLAPETATFVVLGLLAFIFSLAYSALVQAGTSDYMLTDDKILDLMVGAKWQAAADEARFVVANRGVDTIKSLDRANALRAKRLQKALAFQLAYVLLLVLATVFEICARIK